jgi:hypothetical protein
MNKSRGREPTGDRSNGTTDTGAGIFMGRAFEMAFTD